MFCKKSLVAAAFNVAALKTIAAQNSLEARRPPLRMGTRARVRAQRSRARVVLAEAFVCCHAISF